MTEMAVNMITIEGYSVNHTKPPAKGRNGVVLPGQYNGTPHNLTIDEDLLSKHFLLIGGTGCGKTNVFNFFVKHIKNTMTNDDVMIVFDTKGDYYSRFYQPGDIVIANSKRFSQVAKVWNIYKEIVIDGWDDSDIFNNTHEITHSFFKDAIEKSQQQFFPSAARDLLAAILIANIRLGEKDISFRKQILNNKALSFYLNSMTVDHLKKLLRDSDLGSVLSYLGDGNNTQALGVIAELQNVVRQIIMGSFAEHGGFSVRNFVRKKGGRTLFIEYDLSIGDTLAPMYRLLFDLALKEALGRNKTEGNVFLICDEFKLLPNLQHIDDGVNFGRSLGVKIIAGLQSIDQLYEIYGENRGHSIASGFSSVISFKSNDTTTREFVSDLYGKNIVLEQYRKSNNMIEEETREGKTVEDWDINALQVGEAIVGLAYEKPFKYKFDIFHG